MRYDMFSCEDCTKSVCLDIQKKMSVIEKLNLLLRTLNTNDSENEEKLYGIWPNLSEKMTGFFVIIIGEKASTNLPLNKT